MAEAQAPAGGFSVISLAFGIAMLVVGIQYQDQCKNDGAYYLEVQGGYMVGMCIFGVLACFMDPNSIPVKIAGAVGSISGFGILIWGSVTIFGKSFTKVALVISLMNDWSFLGSYADWTYADSDAENENYCPYTPFMWSFVWLILCWSLVPLACCCGAIALKALL